MLDTAKAQTTAAAWKAAIRNPFGIALIVYYLAMAIVGLWVPDNILKDNPWAREFSDFMAAIVPQIDRITALNIKPDVNRFYFSVLWAGSPVLFLICCLLLWDGRKHNYPMWITPFDKAILYIAGCVLLIVWTQRMWGVEPAMRLAKGQFGSPLGRAFYAQIVFQFGAVFLASGIFVWLLGYLSGYIPRNIERHPNG